jgi:hypothetical protein
MIFKFCNEKFSRVRAVELVIVLIEGTHGSTPRYRLPAISSVILVPRSKLSPFINLIT